MIVALTSKSGLAGFDLIPETETERNYLCDLDRDNLRLFWNSNQGILEAREYRPAPAVAKQKQ